MSVLLLSQTLYLYVSKRVKLALFMETTPVHLHTLSEKNVTETSPLIRPIKQKVRDGNIF